MVAGLGWRGSKFRRDVGGPSVGGIDIMMSSEPRSVARLARSPLLPTHFASPNGHVVTHLLLRLIELYGRIVVYGTRAGRPRARADGSLMHGPVMADKHGNRVEGRPLVDSRV
jgi:hypothetical protein